MLQRKVIRCGNFADLDALAEAVLAFQEHYNATAAPFDWRFATADLDAYLARLDAHRRQEAAALAA